MSPDDLHVDGDGEDISPLADPGLWEKYEPTPPTAN